MNPTQVQQIPIDAAKEAADLADLFNQLSDSLDDFRLNAPTGTPPAQLSQLKDEAQALTDRAHHFTALSMAATLQAIQNDLAKIKAATASAAAQVAVLNNVSKVISIATAGVALGAAIASGNPASIVATAEGLVQAVG
jgi:hypothetical protein